LKQDLKGVSLLICCKVARVLLKDSISRARSPAAKGEAEKAAKALEAERRAYEEAKETLAKLGPKFEPKLELAKVSKPDVVIYPEKLPTDATKSWRFPDYYHGRYYAKVATYDTKTRYGMVRLDMDGAEVQFRASMYYPQVYSGGPVVGQDVEVTFQRGEMTGVYAVTLGPVEQQLSFPFCK
jgi:predicted lipoprotein